VDQAAKSYLEWINMHYAGTQTPSRSNIPKTTSKSTASAPSTPLRDQTNGNESGDISDIDEGITRLEIKEADEGKPREAAPNH